MAHQHMVFSAHTRRLALALGLYIVLTALYFACASPSRLWNHTPYNHFALLADGWLHGRLALEGEPPAYTGYNDFAKFANRWFVAFPPFPAVLLLPFVAFAKSAEAVRDGQLFISIAALGPVVLFFALERLRDAGYSEHTERIHLALAALLGLGTVYWFTAEQGTVWFAAHVVGVILAAAYLLASVRSAHPVWAGLAVGLGFWTRTPLLFAMPLFVLEAARVSLERGTLRQSVSRFFVRIALFAIPVVVLVLLSFWYNQARFGNPLEFGYRFLWILWRAHIDKWGLFSYHYFARNLGVLLTSLPYRNLTSSPDASRWQVSMHGLALWITSPFYLYLLWPKRKSPLQISLLFTAACVALPSLLYQNTGMDQFGYRFSNDYAVFLFALLALGRNRFPLSFWVLGAMAIGVNLLGAISFEHAGWERYYDSHRSTQIFQLD